MPVQDELKDLLEKQLQGRLTASERSRFLDLLRQPKNRLILEDNFEAILQENRYHDTPGLDKETLFNEVMREAADREAATPIIPLYKKWLPYAAAIIIALSIGAWYITKTEKQSIVAQNTATSTDTLSTTGKVMLTLADGTQVAVDQVSDGEIDNGMGADIRKQQGVIVFKPMPSANKETVYNTITIARGKQYHIILPDKTEVWLNAASSLKFPTAFNGNERNVILTGEGYFEVAKNAAQPFIVTANKTNVKVLGTHFNVMAYHDEGDVKTTLLEGSVQLKQQKANVVLKPGEQGSMSANDFKIIRPNLEQIMAWKNGEFRFENTRIETIMRQVERWYDLDVIYKNDIPADLALSGVISRKEKVTQLLDILEATHKVRFSMEGNKVTVMPYQEK